MADVRISVDAPLRDCFRHCGIDGDRDFCDIDGSSVDTRVIDTDLVVAWTRQVGCASASSAVQQLGDLIALVRKWPEIPPGVDVAKWKLLAFFGAFLSVLERAAQAGVAPDRYG
jgi:hypothetical protein